MVGAFHTNIWLDEAYSVAISNHNYAEIWSIGGHDVHPVLYYWLLHTLFLVFGNNILVIRLFSVLLMAVLGLIGFTHIRKDFGEKIGILFSFFVFFLPVNLIYASEIRMYTLAMLLVVLMGIYAYRLYRKKEEKSIKNWIFFAIFSLASAYTHYYALIAAGIINILLFIHLIIEIKKNGKFTFNIKAFLICAIFQIASYLPWVIYLILQMKQVSSRFWIGIKFPDILIEFFTFQFVGNLGENLYVSNLITGIFGILICAYMIYVYVRNRKQKKENKDVGPAKLAISIYVSVFLIACFVSLILWRPIIYARYMLCITGLFIFFLAFSMATKGNKYITSGICVISLLLSIYINVKLIQINYDSTNQEPFTYLKENLQPTDLIIYGNEGSGFVISANYPNNKQYFWNQENWNVEEAYKAFGENMKTVSNLDELKDYKGRILVVNVDNYNISEVIQEEYENVKVLDKKAFKTQYKKINYTFSMLEKY